MENTGCILIADDEQNMRRVVSAMLTREGWEVDEAADGAEARSKLRESRYAALVTDLRMPGMNGLELLKWSQSEFPGMPVVVITAHGSVDTAVEALKQGAFDYITKPFEKDDLLASLRKATSTQELSRSEIHEPITPAGRFDIIGQSPRMKAVYQVIQRVADTPSTVLITGESGTGKELIASALHFNSSRRNKPFIKINAAAIPRELIESELFGFEKGAFTGAVHTKPGRFELANGGTLFLDEIGVIPIEMQVKLLRVLQEQEIERVGGLRTIKIDIRLIAATNRNLEEDVKSGAFREDLYYRLNVVPIHLPPLRERVDDIPHLAAHFMAKYNRQLGKSVRGVTPEAMALLQEYGWPGNIRELENVIERVLLFCDGDQVTPADIPDVVRRKPAQKSSPFIEPGEVPLKEYIKRQTEELEKDMIVRALDKTSGNVTRASRLLKISRKGLQLKMKVLGLRGREDGESPGG
ncbi:MAG: Regulatory protein AtoC [Myxococcota bacterium]|nr:Regulatory protein AtoC [Myxococcota bacterium]